VKAINADIEEYEVRSEGGGGGISYGVDTR